MKIVMIIPFRADQENIRKRNLLKVLAYYNQKFETVVVEQPNGGYCTLPPDNRIFWSGATVSINDSGFFNRSKLLNIGTRMYPDADWYIFSDGDVIHPNLMDRIPDIKKFPDGMFISPKRHIVDLTEEQTQHFIDHWKFTVDPATKRFRNYVTDGSALCI
jgi:hypothetical protein